MSRARRLIICLEVAALVGSCAIAVATSEQRHWEHPELIGVLIALAVLSEIFPIESGTLRISGAFPALILLMAFGGPLPAAVAALVCVAVDTMRSRSNGYRLLFNVSAHATFPVIGALAVAESGLLPEAGGEALVFASVVAALYVASDFLNFLLIVGPLSVMENFSLREKIRSVYGPMFPVEVCAAMLTGTVAYGYQSIGFAAIVLSAIVGFVFVYLVRVNLQATERGEQLQLRSQQLASLQVGLVTTVLRTLSLRDHMTARHSAAVARYSRAVARTMGLPAHEQEVIHTAGLLHDIGKFIFPDSILLADRRLSDDDYEIVKRHPEQGAALVRQIQGYDEVADIIIAHHERIDGLGYPFGLSGDEIPLGARIMAVADTYDVITARDSYRAPLAPEAAIVELQRVSGTQLDSAIVDIFVDLVRRNEIEFRHADDADFEAELNFDRRVRDYAEPRRIAA